MNEQHVRQFYQMLGHKNETEIRLIDPKKKETPKSIFVNNEDEFVNQCKKYNGTYQIYAGLNERTKGGTKNKDVIHITSMLLDIDPVRPKDTSATEEQIEMARNVAEQLDYLMKEEYEYEPNMLFSGNGFQIIINFSGIDPKVNGLGTETKCKKYYEIISQRFNDYDVRIDPTHDPARICKVSGTLSIKGDVHRLAYPINELKRRECKQLQDFIESLEITEELPVLQKSNKPQDVPYKDRLNSALKRSDKLKKLLHGDYRKVKNSKGDEYESRSEAELGTVCLLVYYEFSDEEINTIMTNDCNIRKWEEETDNYKQRTIKNSRLFVRETFSKSPNRFFTKDEKGTFVPAYLGQEVIDENKIKTFYDNEEMIMYNNQTGLWIKDSVISIKEICSKKLGVKEKKNHVDEAISFIKHRTYLDRKVLEDNKNHIPINNGIYDLENDQLLEYSSEHYFMNKLNVNYDPEAECPNIDKFFSEIVDIKNNELLYEMIGYTMYRGCPLEKAFLLEGRGANGKSKLIELINDILGEDNTTALSLQNLTYDKFSLCNLYLKYANLFADLSTKAITNSGMFKMLVSGDNLQVDQKYGKFFKFHNYAKLIFSANEMPIINDNSDAIFRRMIIIRFPNTFEGKNRDTRIIDKITTDKEKSGLLNKLIFYLKNILENERFTDEDTTQSNREYYTRISDPVGSFVLDCCEYDVDSTIPKDKLYSAYVKYCKEKSATIIPNNKFSQALVTHIDVYNGRITPEGGGTQVRVWKNIAFKEEKKKEVENNPTNPTKYDGELHKYNISNNSSQDSQVSQVNPSLLVSMKKEVKNDMKVHKRNNLTNLTNPTNCGKCEYCGIFGDGNTIFDNNRPIFQCNVCSDNEEVE